MINDFDDLSRRLTGIKFFESLESLPDFFIPIGNLGYSIINHSDLDLITREIVIVRTASLANCKFELYHHKPIALRVGVSGIDLVKLLKLEVEFDDDKTNSLVAFVDELHVATVADTATLLPWFTEEEIKQIILVHGYYKMLAGYINSFGIQP
jgi:hypothetical protein